MVNTSRSLVGAVLLTSNTADYQLFDGLALEDWVCPSQ